MEAREEESEFQAELRGRAWALMDDSEKADVEALTQLKRNPAFRMLLEQAEEKKRQVVEQMAEADPSNTALMASFSRVAYHHKMLTESIDAMIESYYRVYADEARKAVNAERAEETRQRAARFEGW